MKLSLGQKESIRTAENQHSSTLVKENSHLFNCIDKLAADHNVTVSTTMIKVTYKKSLKDHLEVNNCDETVLNKAMNSNSNSNDKSETIILCNSDISQADKPPSKGSQVFHSTPKHTKGFINGIHLNETQEGGATSSADIKTDIMFLKESLMKSKRSIKSKGKKLATREKHRKKFKKLKNGLKAKKVEEMKRKAEEDMQKSKKLKTGEEKEGVNMDKNETVMSRSGKKPILLVDPDLPPGWTRFIRTKNKGTAHEQYVVYVVNPQGKKFRFKWKLRKFLAKTNSPLDADQFFFGLYKRTKPLMEKEDKDSEEAEETGSLSENQKAHCSRINNNESYSDHENDIAEFTSEKDERMGPMYDDPNLPEGWRRFIKVRGCGESAGRMEVVIVSPDGRRHRNKKHLEYYLRQKNLNFKLEDFDFSVFGRSNLKKRPPQLLPPSTPKPEVVSNDFMFSSVKKKFSDKPVPELDIESLNEPKITQEGRLINEVNGLMISSGLSSARSERRHKLPRNMQQNRLKNYLNAEGEVSTEGKDIPTWWIQRLMKCRSDFRDLEPDAATAVAERTKEFLKELSARALGVSEDPDKGLRYEDVAKIVDQTESLSSLKTLIPKKITYREFIKLNRPKQFMSFT